MITADGRPASRIYLQLFDAQDIGDAASSIVDGATTDPEGRFTIERLPAGEYLLAVNPIGIQGRQPYPVSFFGGADRASATRISVGEGAPTVLDCPFALAPARATRTFTYAVSCRDGSTPPFTHAEARPLSAPGVVEHDLEEGTPPVQTLTLLRDQAYSLVVTASVPSGAPGPNGQERRGQTLPPIDIPAGTPGRHIALTAPFANCGDGTAAATIAEGPISPGMTADHRRIVHVAAACSLVLGLAAAAEGQRRRGTDGMSPWSRGTPGSSIARRR